VTLLRCIAPGCKPAWFRLATQAPDQPAGSAAPMVHCPYCGNPAPYELYFAAAAGSTRVAHEVVITDSPAPLTPPSARRNPMVRFNSARPGDKVPPLVPPESARREHTCPHCSARYASYAPTSLCPACGAT
jgi:hypothetical protein